jgi:lipoate---protein ligase
MPSAPFGLALAAAGGDPFRNLALEESLLERGLGDRGALLLYADSPCLVIGRNQNPWAELREDAGLPVLRRASGGGAVYHDEGNLNWALIAPRAGHDRPSELALVARALRSLGIESEEGARGGLYVTSPARFAGTKISGTARRIAAERVLHHGTLLVDADLSRMRRCLGGIEVERSRALASVSSPCVNLAEILPGLTLGEVAAALAKTIAGADPLPVEELADGPSVEAIELRLRSWDWTWGATPAFELALPGSLGLARIRVERGRIASMSGPGTEACSSLLGTKFDYGSSKACVAAMESAGFLR